MDRLCGCVQTMMTSLELRALLKDVMTKAGFVKQGPAWVKSTDELLWMVQLDRSPYGERFSLDIGASLLSFSGTTAPVKVNDCPILIHLENLPLTAPLEVQDPRFSDFRSATIRAFDLTHELEDEERKQSLTSIVEALGAYIRGIENKRDLRVRYEAGDFRSALIRKDVKQQLLMLD
jgi:hypothetical protein